MSIGRIAAANSFPDVYAMGGRPLRYSVKTNQGNFPKEVETAL